MKKVLSEKQKYNFKDVIRWLLYIVFHYMFIVIYVGIFLLILIFSQNDNLKDIIKNHIPLFVYIVIAPMINAVVHIIYKERGITKLKATLWLHSAFFGLLIPLILFLNYL